MSNETEHSYRSRTALIWLVTILVPVVLVVAAVRAALSPLYLEFIYRTPGFPSDPLYYHLPAHLEPFSREDRLHYANIAIDYLLNDAPVSFLGDLRFPEGQEAPPSTCQYMDDCTRLYNERELQHMIDVKVVVQATLRVWSMAVAGLLLLGVWSWYGGWFQAFKRDLARGAWLTLLLIAAILVLVLVAFGFFFTFFHNVFFEPGTWMFLSSDTLIRLFPERFWQLTFLVVGGLSAGMALLVIWLARPKKQRVDIYDRPLV